MKAKFYTLAGRNYFGDINKYLMRRNKNGWCAVTPKGNRFKSDTVSQDHSELFDSFVSDGSWVEVPNPKIKKSS